MSAPDYLDDIIFRVEKVNITGFHGLAHWEKVNMIGQFLADKNGADKKVIECFAYLHDVGRRNELDDPGHGHRSVEIIERMKDRLSLDDKQYRKLLRAVQDHNKKNAESRDITVKTCCDADRLDLFRAGVIPDKRFLYTKDAIKYLEGLI